MLVSRVMSKKEFNNFLAGKTIRPRKGSDSIRAKEARMGWTEAYNHSEFQNGCMFFVPGDIRKMSLYDINNVVAMTLGDRVWRNDTSNIVACVFDIEDHRLTFGKARLETLFGDHHYHVAEAYASFYNRKTARLIAVDKTFMKRAKAAAIEC